MYMYNNNNNDKYLFKVFFVHNETIITKIIKFLISSITKLIFTIVHAQYIYIHYQIQ